MPVFGKMCYNRLCIVKISSNHFKSIKKSGNIFMGLQFFRQFLIIDAFVMTIPFFHCHPVNFQILFLIRPCIMKADRFLLIFLDTNFEEVLTDAFFRRYRFRSTFSSMQEWQIIQ